MFKRLTKSKRHSVEGVGADPRPPASSPSPPPSPTNELTASLEVPNVGSARAPHRAKQARRSSGDQPLNRVIQPLDDYRRDDEEHEADHQPSRITRVSSETDYQMVTAVPAYIVEHEPEKQKGLGVWGRRMSKKIDSFRRSNCRDALVPENGAEKTRPQVVESRRFSSPQQRSASPFKSFFIRMGSTGMLNSAKSNRRSLQGDEESQNYSRKSQLAHGVILRSSRTPEKDQAPLFRSCSTSQLNTTLTYVKGDDPSEGIDLRISGKDSKTVSCDNLAGQILDDIFEPAESISKTSLNPNPETFYSCDYRDGHRSDVHLVRKSVSCEFREPRESKEVKKTNFPYAFLRSKLSVLPEEKHGIGTGIGIGTAATKQSPEDRLFKTASEEHFPSLLRVEDGTETTTLGRRRSRPSGGSASYFRTGGRNSYSEYRSPSYDQERRVSPSSMASIGQDQIDFGTMDYADLETAGNIAATQPTTTLRCQRRNSAPSAEQRLSSHYVSSNESGYDSDGPRGESTTTSETEAMSLNRADSSDTSSVIDSEIEKPTRSSTPSEYTENPEGMHVNGHHHSHQHQMQLTVREETVENGLEGLRWHQTTSGRILPSINQTPVLTQEESPSGQREVTGENCVSLPHRVRLRLEKTKFLSDIIQPGERVLQRRCRLVNLTKTDPAESLGIRLAQQKSERLRYVVVELENKGIAHRDGRLRLGDEIVEVEGRDLSTLESLQAVQDFLASFRGIKIQLLTAYDESVPEVCPSPVGLLPGETEYFENAKTLSNISLCEERRTTFQEKNRNPQVEQRKRPDFLPLSISTATNAAENSPPEILLEAHRYLTRHTARFEKGYGRPSLGFSVVGGRDSPRGEMGIFVRRVFPGGQADVSKSLLQGDEILTLNGKILRGFTHREVIELFKAVREGPVELEIARRHRYPKSVAESATY